MYVCVCAARWRWLYFVNFDGEAGVRVCRRIYLAVALAEKQVGACLCARANGIMGKSWGWRGGGTGQEYYTKQPCTHMYIRTHVYLWQDALNLLKKRNLQLLVQGRELNAARLEAQVR